MRLRSTTKLCVLLALISTFGVATKVLGGQAFRPAAGTFGPSQDLLVTRPNMRLEIWAPDGRAVTTSEMRIDDQVVKSKYDTQQKALLYACDSPLAEGEHTVLCRVGFKDTPVFRTSWKFRVLPDALNDLPAPNTKQLEAMKVVNEFRRGLGLPEAISDPVLDYAADRHADYCAQNNVMTHVQKPGLPGYSGQTSQERLARLGWIGASSEGLTSGEATLQEAMNNLFDSPYHRIPFLQPGQLALGTGQAGDKLALEFSKSDDSALTVSPSDGQTAVPISWSRNETPNPLRLHSGATAPTGYPIVVALFGRDRKLVSFNATLKCQGKDVPFFQNAPDNDQELQSQAIIIPKDPLTPNAIYEVTIHGSDEAGQPVDKSWTFKTGRDSH